MNELEKKRDEKFMNENKGIIYNILNFIYNKDKIKDSQETFKVDSIQKFQRMKELLTELYNEKVLILQTMEGEGRYLTVLNVNNKDNLALTLNQLLNECLGENYTVTKELLVFPVSLSFSNEEQKLILINYDSGVVDV